MGVLDGKVAIVTGTSRGVGVGIAKRLLEAGASVVGCSRRELPTLPAAAEVPGAAERSAQWVCDQTDWRRIDAFVARVVERFGRIDVLVNNAGGTVPTPHVEDVPVLVTKLQGAPRADDAFERTALFHAFAVQNNLIGPLWFAIRVAREMLAQDGTGSIVNISSGASHPTDSPSLVSYSAAEAGLNHMTRSLAEEWGPKIGSTVSRSGRPSPRNSAGSPEREAEHFANVPLRRAGEPDEVCNTVVFLCSGAADIIDGRTIEMDGGMLPGVPYEPGLAPICAMLAAAERGEGRGQ